MSKRTKLKLRNMQMFMTKYVFNSKFIVRNLLAVTIMVSLIAVIAGTAMMIKSSSTDNKKESPQELAVIYTYNTAEINTDSISMIKTSLDNDNKETVVEANETQMVSETTGEFDARFIATGSDINIREEASTDSAIVGTLNQGDVGDILSSDGEWLKINSGSVTGYVKAEFVLTGSEAEEYAVNYQTSKGVVTETGVYIRQSASTESEIIGTANQGDSFEINKSTTDTLEGWVCIYLEDGATGYICSDYVNVQMSYSSATPVIDEEDTVTNEKEVEESEETTETTETTESSDTTQTVTTQETTETTTDNQIAVTETTRAAVSLSAEDINLMAAVIYLESGCESYEGQLAVANVIITRLLSGAYGSTVSDVVYAPYQFTVVNSSQMDDLIANGAPSSCVTAAQEAAAGRNNIGSFSCFKPSWNVNTSALSSYVVIGNHVFY